MKADLALDMSSSISIEEEDALYKKVILRIVPLFFIGFILSYLDRVNISFAKLQMAADFGLTNASFAVGASVFFWGYMLFEIPSNLVLQKVGARAWIARIMITWGIVSMLMIFSRSEPVFYSLRFLLGVCELICSRCDVLHEYVAAFEASKRDVFTVPDGVADRSCAWCTDLRGDS